MSARGALEVDELTSWARRRDEGIEVSVRLPGTRLQPGPVQVRLVAGDARRRSDGTARADGDDTVLDFRVDQERLGPRAWQITVRSGEEPFRRVRARLLAVADQPVALLPGPAPATVHAAPRPHAPQVPQTRLRRVVATLPPPVRSRLIQVRDTARQGVRAARGLRERSAGGAR
ncbi:hypothetical protein GHK92_19045 [Nocardioides sp. dk4132]|uniref:hypothetical protein n=1 Tax=unclassified Nocardioides TaxID=2615069 RepID=UPI001297776F|nr:MULTISPECIES: hypothetical protein [unclassified Nocardioides]MQW77969.1 hypothetical protein [Nocardioides sp. dk4132]QGA09109.1 hypothetical protein GFH29_18200 [Nocardioides sp. dk884]